MTLLPMSELCSEARHALESAMESLLTHPRTGFERAQFFSISGIRR
jgi:hypothetical protein